MNGITQLILFWGKLLVSFTYYTNSEIHPSCSMNPQFIPFLLLSNIPPYGYTMICLSIHLLVDNLLVSSLGLLQLKLP